jgi:hypothetical protein
MLFRLLLLTLPFLTLTFACSCLPITQKKAYNQAEIVAHVTITSKTTDSDSNIRYDIYYNETFKPSHPKNPHIIIPVPLPNTIVTASSSAACGVDSLEVGEDYLVAGNFTS